MKMKNLYKIALGCFVAGSTLTSCDDFLTIKPTSQIVEEDFWEDKNDLENVVAACYVRLLQGDMMERYILWGEARSDNFVKTVGKDWVDMDNLMSANLLPTAGMFSWTPFYNEINFCNKILKNGPLVLERDVTFTEEAWKPIKAEAITLRALSHFWLVRTFGDIPYATSDYNNDGQYMLLPQTPQEQVLDSIIMDLESVKADGMTNYGNTVFNKGRITQKSIYALLADVYLWRASLNASPDSVNKHEKSRADYQKCIECCDFVIEQMIKDKTEDINKNGSVVGGLTKALTVEDLLTPNDPNANSYSDEIGAFNDIFGSKNSDESIFEIQIDGTNNTNAIMASYFYNISKAETGSFCCADALFSGFETSPNSTGPSSLFTKTDMRKWEDATWVGADQTEYRVNKYIASDVMQGKKGVVGLNQLMTDNTASDFEAVYTNRSTDNANWIFYRLSDVMLMKAEAISQLYTDEANLREGFTLVRHIFKRSNPYAYSTTNSNASNDSLNFETFSTPEGLEALVMAERQREFFAEGKRWFDLVRYAQRKGSTTEMVKNFLGRKYSENKNAIVSKLSTLESLFSPIYESEIKNNPLLKQNSVWKTNENTSKTDEI